MTKITYSYTYMNAKMHAMRKQIQCENVYYGVNRLFLLHRMNETSRSLVFCLCFFFLKVIVSIKNAHYICA